jgi:uncharacterized protein YndB with AHSA1/START domain
MTINHATFMVTRTYPQPVDKVFHAFSDESTKRRWVAARDHAESATFRMDFRVDGQEFSAFHLPDNARLPPEVRGQRITNEAVYQYIATNERILYAYRMTIGGVCMSVSLATVTFEASSKGTKVTFTEQGCYFANADGAGMREGGWNDLLNRLGMLLESC